MRRWTLGVLVSAFFAGVAFVLTTIMLRMLRIYLHGPRPSPTWLDLHSQELAFVFAIGAAGVTLLLWGRATRSA